MQAIDMLTLSAPAVFSPYGRLELLKWDPLHEDAYFFYMKWYILLALLLNPFKY